MRTERGAISIHVVLALTGVLMFAGMVIDQGVLYVARRQAQTAADAGALAGAIWLQTNFGDFTNAAVAAKALANQNPVWAESVGDANIDVTVPIICPDHTPGCIRVDVMRGQPGRFGGHGNTIPTYLVRLVGPTSQGVRATATAQVAAGNAVQCIKPIVVADKWTDNSSTGSNLTGWDQEDVFGPGDVYTRPGFKASGPGNDIGLEVVLKGDDANAAGWSREVELGGGNGGNVIPDEFVGCPTWVQNRTFGIYEPDPAKAPPCASKVDTNEAAGCLNVKQGTKQGPISSGVHALKALDPSATWNAGTNSVSGGCSATATCTNSPDPSISPRVVPIAVFNPQQLSTSTCSGDNCVVQVVNIFGFFVEGMCDDADVYGAAPPGMCGAHPNQVVVGRLVNYPAIASGFAGSAGPETFLKITRLVK
jgi:hypothetical protein